MIYVITHKVFDSDFIDRTYYKILHVGINNNCSDKYLRDDVGDNISTKNAYYCELTGLYWIWKNGLEKPENITGMVHYRRFFTNGVSRFLYDYLGKMPPIINYENIERIMEKYDVILPKKKFTFRSVKHTYEYFHNGEDINIIAEAIKKIYPSYYETFEKIMDGHRYYYANMIICSKKKLDQYAEWLFDLLKEIEKHIDINKYENEYQQRVYGFMAERLLQVWVMNNNLKVKELYIYNTEIRGDTLWSTNAARITRLLEPGTKKQI